MNCNTINKYQIRQVDTSDYINFLNDMQVTEYGKTYSDLMEYKYDDIESDCRFIQWIFPLAEGSAFASNVPVIDIEILQKHIKKDNTIVEKIIKSHDLMMDHWGLYDGDLEKIKLLNGHNALRFSRMLQSLIYHGQKKLAFDAYKLSYKYFGNENDNLNVLKPKIISTSRGDVDVWEFHLIKAMREMHELIKV
jgi:hypothetical protein